ncbi:unnamed protein product [Symbiodinium microadriaticum]|nr:unnamed protein product [Symbiodinium microadriaticum]
MQQRSTSPASRLPAGLASWISCSAEASGASASSPWVPSIASGPGLRAHSQSGQQGQRLCCGLRR